MRGLCRHGGELDGAPRAPACYARHRGAWLAAIEHFGSTSTAACRFFAHLAAFPPDGPPTLTAPTPTISPLPRLQAVQKLADQCASQGVDVLINK